MRKKLPWFEIVLAIVLISAYIYAALSDAYNLPNRFFIRDDAYYYFKVAQNISEGHGSTFDGLHVTNGYHPLWMVVCIPIFALARFDPILPLRVLVVVIGLLQTITAILLYRLVRSAVSTPVAIMAAAYWGCDSYIVLFLYKTGVESSIALLFIVLLLVLTLKLEQTWRIKTPRASQIALLGAVAALVVFARLDLIFFALIMGIWIVLRQSPLRYLLPLDLLTILVSVLGAFIARLGIGGYYDAATAALATVVIAAIVRVPVFFLLGLYTPPSSWRLPALLVRVVLAVAASSIVIALLSVTGAALHIVKSVPRVALLYDAGITLLLVLLVRLTAYVFSTREGKPAPAPLQHLREHARTWLRDGSLYYGVVGGTLALYMLWNRLTVGSFSPVSGEIKRWWGTFWISVYGGPAKSLLSFFTLDTYGDFNAWAPASTRLRDLGNAILQQSGDQFGNPTWQRNYIILLLIAFVAVVAIALLARRASARAVVQAGMIPLFVGSWFQALSYNATGYASPKEWYWLTQPLLIVLVAALLLNVLIELVLKRWRLSRALVWVLVAAFALRSAQTFWYDTLALNPYGQTPAGTPYLDVVKFIEDYTPPGSVIGITGGGNIGYFIHDRTIVNMDGLINSPQYFASLKAGTAADYLYNSGTRYVFANPDILKANPYRGQFDKRLMGVESWGGKDLMKLLPDPSE